MNTTAFNTMPMPPVTASRRENPGGIPSSFERLPNGENANCQVPVTYQTMQENESDMNVPDYQSATVPFAFVPTEIVNKPIHVGIPDIPRRYLDVPADQRYRSQNYNKVIGSIDTSLMERPEEPNIDCERIAKPPRKSSKVEKFLYTLIALMLCAIMVLLGYMFMSSGSILRADNGYDGSTSIIDQIKDKSAEHSVADFGVAEESGELLLDAEIDPNSEKIPTDSSRRTIDTVISEQCAIPGSESLPQKWYRNNLSGTYAQIYDLMEAGFRNYQSSIVFPSSLSTDDTIEIFDNVLMDNDDIFWIDVQFDVYRDAAGNIASISPIYKYDKSQRNEIQTEINRQVASAMQFASSAENDYKKALKIAEWLSINCGRSNDLASCQDIESVFIGRNSVCAGYSHAFAYLCEKAGIQCLCITGTATNGRQTEEHVWNALVIAGTVCYADVFWGDLGNAFNVDKFGLSYSTISNDHWAKRELAPRTTSNRFEIGNLKSNI